MMLLRQVCAPDCGTGSRASGRPSVRGKFIYCGGEKLFIRGVTYGTFRPDANGDEFPSPETVERDFDLMHRNGVNAVRTTRRAALVVGRRAATRLLIMAGLPVERSAAFLDYRECVRAAGAMCARKVRALAGHSALLCFTIGNEIPASIVRWLAGGASRNF